MVVQVFLFFVPVSHRAHSLGWMVPAWRPLERLLWKPQLYVSHQCACASVSLRCPQCPLPTCPPNAGPLFWTRPAIAWTPQNLHLFGSSLFLLGAWPLLLNLATDGDFDLQTESICSHIGTTHLAWSLAHLESSCYLYHILQSPWRLHLLCPLRKKDGSCSNKTSIQCCTINSGFFPFSAPQSHDTQAELCLSDSLYSTNLSFIIMHV